MNVKLIGSASITGIAYGLYCGYDGRDINKSIPLCLTSLGCWVVTFHYARGKFIFPVMLTLPIFIFTHIIYDKY